MGGFLGTRQEEGVLFFGVQGVCDRQCLANRAMGFLDDENVNGVGSHLLNELMILGGGAETLYVPGRYFDRSVSSSDGKMSRNGGVKNPVRGRDVGFKPGSAGGIDSLCRRGPGTGLHGRSSENTGVYLRLFQGLGGAS